VLVKMIYNLEILKTMFAESFHIRSSAPLHFIYIFRLNCKLQMENRTFVIIILVPTSLYQCLSEVIVLFTYKYFIILFQPISLSIYIPICNSNFIFFCGFLQTIIKVLWRTNLTYLSFLLNNIYRLDLGKLRFSWFLFIFW